MRAAKWVMVCLAFGAAFAGSAPSVQADYIFGGSGGTPNDLTVVTTSGVTVLSTSAGLLSEGNNQGWWSPTDAGVDSNDNYFAGDFGGAVYNDFFSFDISGLAGETVLSASFEPFAYAISAAYGVIYTLYDVSTDPLTLNTNTGASAAIHGDLGSGVSYGSFFVPTGVAFTTLTLPLNGFGVADLQAAIDGGRYFSIGGTASAAIVPEPGSLTLVGLGAFGLVAGAIRRRRQQKA